MSQDEPRDAETQAGQSLIHYPLPQLLASTGDTHCCSVSETLKKEKESNTETVPVSKDAKNGQHDVLDESQRAEDSNYFKGAQWSADGTTIVASSADHHLRAFILPPTLLSPPHPHNITPYTTYPSHEPIYAHDIYPHFNLSTPATTLLLSSPRDHPIRLTNILSPSTPHSCATVAIYPLVSPTTERHVTPHSLLFHPSGTHFLAGSDSLLTLFDLSRPGSAPITRVPTIPSKRKKLKGGGVGMKGLVSALAMSPSSSGDSSSSSAILAAGTFTRHVALYDTFAAGGCIATFSVARTDAEASIGGRGITQVLWSSDGRYLYVAERMGRGVMVYDIRVTGRLVGWVGGRAGATMQRLGMALVGAEQGEELWGGGTDGMVRVWRRPHLCGGGDDGEERRGADWAWRAGTDAITSALVHPMGAVMATCSGQRHERVRSWDEESGGDEDETGPGKAAGDCGRGEFDNRLKIWGL